jgi:hypothetical protein
VRRYLAVAALSLLLAAGCATARQARIGVPTKHQVKSDQLLVVSDFKIGRDHPLIRDLMQLRREVSETLELPLGSRQVMVYLFSNELEYTQYLQATFPGYPPRRAYFIQTPGRELAVYTWWGDRIQEDLRHEFTHGLLHASLENVPLWLDEGLAEYFEMPEAQRAFDHPHLPTLRWNLRLGMLRTVESLENHSELSDMGAVEYRYAWAWVHFMLHGPQAVHRALVNYVADIRRGDPPGVLSERLHAAVPMLDERMIQHFKHWRRR